MITLLLYFLIIGEVWGSPPSLQDGGTTQDWSSLLRRMDTLEALLKEQDTKLASQELVLQDQVETIADQTELLKQLNWKVSDQESLNQQQEILLSAQAAELSQQRDVLQRLLAVDARGNEGVRETEEL